MLYMVAWIPSIYPSHVSIYTIHGSYDSCHDMCNTNFSNKHVFFGFSGHQLFIHLPCDPPMAPFGNICRSFGPERACPRWTCLKEVARSPQLLLLFHVSIWYIQYDIPYDICICYIYMIPYDIPYDIYIPYTKTYLWIRMIYVMVFHMVVHVCWRYT